MNYCLNAVIFFQYLRGRFFRVNQRNKEENCRRYQKCGENGIYIEARTDF